MHFEILMDKETFTTDNSSDLMNTMDLPESYFDRILETSLIINTYYTPFIALIGILGNSLSVGVFCIDPKYRTQSASIYLSSLAISDAGFLLTLLTIWLEEILPRGGFLILSNFSCSLVMYLGQVTCFLSVYLQLAFSIERYIAVSCPLSRPRICTRSKAKKCVAILTVTALLIFSYCWVIARVVKFAPESNSTNEEGNATLVNSNISSDSLGFNISNINIMGVGGEDEDDISLESVCTVPAQFYKVSEIANYVDTIITLIIPFFLISFFNIQIARKVLGLKGERKEIVAMTGIASKKETNQKKWDTDANATSHFRNNQMKKDKNISTGNDSTDKNKMITDNEKGDQIAPGNSCTEAQNSLQSKPANRAALKQKITLLKRRSSSPSKLPNSSSEVRVAKTLLLVTTVFLALNLPSHVIRCAQFIQSLTGSQEENHFLRLLQPWAHILFNTSFAVNFLLYCLSGRNFRLSLNNVCLRMWRREPNRNRNHNQGKLIHRRGNPLAAQTQCCSQNARARVGSAAYLSIEPGMEMRHHHEHETSSFHYTESCLNLISQETEQIVHV